MCLTKHLKQFNDELSFSIVPYKDTNSEAKPKEARLFVSYTGPKGQGYPVVAEIYSQSRDWLMHCEEYSISHLYIHITGPVNLK